MTSLHRDQKFGDCAVHEGKCIPPLRDWGGLGEFLTVEGHQALKHQAENKHLTSDSYDWLIRFFPFTWVQKAVWWPPFPLPHWGKCMLKRGLDLNSRRVTSKSNVSEHVIASFSITFFSIQWDSWAGYSLSQTDTQHSSGKDTIPLLSHFWSFTRFRSTLKTRYVL